MIFAEQSHVESTEEGAVRVVTIQASAQMSGDPQPAGVRQTQLPAACADKIWPLVNKAGLLPLPRLRGLRAALWA